MQPHPIRLVLADDLRRSRLTVFFRLLLAIPHYIWLIVWTLLAIPAAFANWLVTLITGTSPSVLHRFLGAYVRYWTHLNAYLFLAANPFPPFDGRPGDYPIDLEIDPPARQRRWSTAVRLLLAVPALVLCAVLGASLLGVFGGRGPEDESGAGTALALSGFGLAGTVSVLAWFPALLLARVPLGFRNALAYALRYTAQTFAYVFALTDRYPDTNPTLPSTAGTFPPRPIRLVAEEDNLRRSRLTVFFRALLVFPHLVWLMLWGVVAFLAGVAAWVCALVLGRVPGPLHRFLAAYLRYEVHVIAFLFLVANPFPGFLGRERSYPVEVAIDPPERQRRLATLFRLVLAIPALIVSGTLSLALYVVAFFGWFVSLVLGRMPPGLERLGLWAIRYATETNGYLWLLTPRYPFSSPPVEPEPEPDQLTLDLAVA